MKCIRNNDIDAAAGLVKYLNKFADDTKLGHCVNSDEDHKSFQQTIDNLLKWSKDWSMEFNVGKCHILHLGRSNARHQYTMGSRVASRQRKRCRNLDYR